MDEMDVESVDLGDVLVEAVESRLGPTPVIGVRPVRRELLRVRKRSALAPVVDGLGFRPPSVSKPSVEVVENLVGDINRERSNLVIHRVDSTDYVVMARNRTAVHRKYG